MDRAELKAACVEAREFIEAVAVGLAGLEANQSSEDIKMISGMVEQALDAARRAETLTATY